jgi:hypothetical protein
MTEGITLETHILSASKRPARLRTHLVLGKR